MGKKIYKTIWRNKWITAGAKSIDDFINTFEGLANHFREWKELGITLEEDGGVIDDYATFSTDDMDVAIKAGFTFYFGDNREKEYLLTIDDEEIEVPKEKLMQHKK